MDIKSTLQDNIQTYIQTAFPNASSYLSTLVTNSASLNRSIGESESYESFLTYINTLGEIPFNVFSRSYPYIYDHMVRNVNNEWEETQGLFTWPKFTYYNGTPNIVLADPELDGQTWTGYYKPDYIFSQEMTNGVEIKYSESADGIQQNKSITNMVAHPGDAHGTVTSFNAEPNNLSQNDLIKKTNDMFTQGRMGTLIARFHTNSEAGKDPSNPTQTAISKKYGMSHGHNLLSGDDPDNNGYDNPYCRVWTYHHQYKDFARDIRPFALEGQYRNDNSDSTSPMTQKTLYGDYSWKWFGNNETNSDNTHKFGGTGRERLDSLGVLNGTTNRPNIVPITDRGKNKNTFLREKRNIVDVKNCMFSIENLAWKTKGRLNYFDKYGLSDEQKGPLGGRIMWFPPYNLSFNESSNADWEQTAFIGRGENIYTYKNTTRKGNLSFTMLIDHPAVLDYWTGWEKNGQKNHGTNLDLLNTGGVDNPNNQEQTILRFFAGCDVLTAAPQQYKKPKKKKETETVVATPNPDTPPEENVKKMFFIIFYPNNYSGKDDAPTVSSSVVSAPDYLINGVGSQKGIKLTDGYFNSESDVTDVPVQIKNADVWHGSEQIVEGVAGYEMLPSPSHSIDFGASAQTRTNASKFTNIITLNGDSGYTKTSDGKCQPTDDAVTFYYDYDNQYVAYKYLGSLAKKDKRYKSNKKANENWFLHRWYYRVDNETSDQELSGTPQNYIDGSSSAMNATGYNQSFVTEFLSDEAKKYEKQISFADAYRAFSNSSEVDSLLSGCTISENVEFAKSVINETNGIKLKEIKVYGNASVHGRKQIYNEDTNKIEDQPTKDETRNETLADGRSTTLGKWLQTFPTLKDKVSIITGDYSGVLVPNTNSGYTESHSQPNVDARKQKVYRSAVAIFYYTEENTTTDVTNNTISTVSADTTEEITENPWNLSTYCKLNGMSDNGYHYLIEEQTICNAITDDMTDEDLADYFNECRGKGYLPQEYSQEDFLNDAHIYLKGKYIYKWLSIDAINLQLNSCATSFMSTYYDEYPKVPTTKTALNAFWEKLKAFANEEYGITQDVYGDNYEWAIYLLQHKVKKVYESTEGVYRNTISNVLGDEEITTYEQAFNDVYNKTGNYNQASIAGNLARLKATKADEQWLSTDSDASEWENMPRYDGEGEFFKQLEFHDPHTFNLVSQKVRYFDPAFHSISPEGFAARLTFLNQCTRQGNTVGASDAKGQTADNLAFGAPPVCVLRVGDFYYTRIIIESINIKYDQNGLQWDLNPEGIGVMPMMADVDISFTFIGGSDLGGPVSRLQNATSFNYYANTSVYDNRAEEVSYDSNGNLLYFKPFIVEQTTDNEYE